MRRMTFCGVVCLVAMAAASVSAQPLADRLPASTLVYVGWSPEAALQMTSTAKMLADERFMGPWRRLFQDFVIDMPDGIDGGERVSAHLPQLLAEAAQCQGCFALLELRQAKGRFNPQSVLMIDLGARRQSFEEHFKPIQLRMKERVGERLKMMKLQNSWVYTKPDRDGKAHLTWGFVGDTFVYFVGDEAANFVPKLIKGKIESNLKAAPGFADCVEKLPGQSIFTTYLDTKGSLALVRRLVEREGNGDLQALTRNWDKVLAEIGADNVKGVVEKTTIQDKQFVTRSLIRTDGAPRGLLGMFAQEGVDAAMLKAIPEDAMAAFAARLDPVKAFEQVKASAINIGGEDAKGAFGQLEQGAEGLGLPIKTVLESVGDQWVIYNAPSHGGFAFTGWTMVTQVKDAQKFNRTLGTLRGMIAKGFGGDNERSRIRVLEVDGLKIEYMEMGRWGSPVSPAWTVVGDKFVLSLYPQLVEDAARQIKEGARSILDNPEFAAARKRTGEGGPLLYGSGPEITKNLYPVGLLFASFLNSFGGLNFRDAEEETRLGADLLPSMQRLLQYVGHDAVAFNTNGDGLLKTRSVGNPLLSPLAWADSPIIWIALGTPFLGASEEAADRLKSANNLRAVGVSIAAYASENKGKFPPDLATLGKSHELQPEALRSPYGPAKDGVDVVLVQYGPNAQPNGPSGHEIIVAYDQAALEQGDGANVLYADGHVEWVAPELFKKALEDSRKKVALQNAQP